MTWTSSDETVAAVSQDGTVTAVARGTATITAYFYGNEKYEACQASYKINVTKKEPKPVTMTFPQDIYTCYTNEAPLFDGFQRPLRTQMARNSTSPLNTQAATQTSAW